MNAIFLDIDGVLNCDGTPNPRDLPYIVDQKLLRRFHRLVKASEAIVILTSSWRIDPVGLYAARYWKIPFDATCPDMLDVPRREEILSWLQKHPRITRYVVIDDEDDGLDDLPLFQTSSKTGLTREICRGVLSYLNGKTNKVMRANLVTRVIENMGAVFHRNKD